MSLLEKSLFLCHMCIWKFFSIFYEKYELGGKLRKWKILKWPGESLPFSLSLPDNFRWNSFSFSNTKTRVMNCNNFLCSYTFLFYFWHTTQRLTAVSHGMRGEKKIHKRVNYGLKWTRLINLNHEKFSSTFFQL